MAPIHQILGCHCGSHVYVPFLIPGNKNFILLYQCYCVSHYCRVQKTVLYLCIFSCLDQKKGKLEIGKEHPLDVRECWFGFYFLFLGFLFNFFYLQNTDIMETMIEK